jgi:glycosyltransferase involved in cell wall biosynthesis
MKVAMVFPHSDSEKGISKYSLELIKNIEKQGIEVDKITFVAGKPLTLFKQLSKISRYDFIHIQHEYNLLGGLGLPYFYVLTYLKFFRKKSLVVTMHTALSLKEKFRGSKLKTILRKILYIIQNKWIEITSDKIIVHAEMFKDILSSEYSIPKSKINVIPHGIIEDIKMISKQDARKELKLSGNVYLLIGTMTPDHGHDVIVKQADKIGKTILVVTNPSKVNDRNESRIKSFLTLLKNIVKENKFEKFVRFDLKDISYELWWKYFSAADLIILPYRGGIGSGLFADAMATKKPVVSSNVPYFKEFEKNYKCLEIAKTEEDFPRAIKESMKPEQYRKMIKECERFFKENNLTAVSKKYKDLYNSLK